MVHDKALDEKYMKMALKEAKMAGEKGEVPIGAVLVRGDQVISKDHNRCIELNDPTAHAEILALRKGGEVLGNYRLNGTSIYVTVEPCAMCVSAMVHGRISQLVFGTPEPKFGAVESKIKLLENKGFYHKVETTRGILERECVEVMRSFFKKRRASKKTVRSSELKGRKPKQNLKGTYPEMSFKRERLPSWLKAPLSKSGSR
jgi:tRNA(adenine34) deaminase